MVDRLITKLEIMAISLKVLTEKQKTEFTKRHNVDNIVQNLNKLSHLIGGVKRDVPDTEDEDKSKDLIN